MKKAITLMVLEKAEAVETRSDVKIRGVHKNFDCPSIVRLKHNRKAFRTRVQLNRKNIMKRDGFTCMYCGDVNDLTIDHIIPKSKGGKTTWENLVTACNKCNNLKDNKLYHEVGLKLKTKPKMPSIIVFLRQEVNTIEENWKPYLYLT